MDYLDPQPRSVLCIGGPMNGQTFYTSRDSFVMPASVRGPAQFGARRFEACRYRVERLADMKAFRELAVAEDVPKESVIILLLEAYAAWHSPNRELKRIAEERGRDWEAEARARAEENRWLTAIQTGIMVPCREPIDDEAVKRIPRDLSFREMLSRPADVQTGAPTKHWRGDSVTVAPVESTAALAVPDPDAPCDDCKSTRIYAPFTGPSIPCPTCRPAAASLSQA